MTYDMSEIDLIQRIQKLEHDVEMLRALESRDLLLPMTQIILTLGISTSGATVAGMVLTRTPIYINRFQANVRVNTTNDGSNYWTLELRTYPGAVAIATADTSALAPSSSVFSRITGSVGYNVPSGQIGLYVQATKTGSPGNLDILGILVSAT